MAKTDTFQCKVITPQRKVLECDASFAAFPAYDGEMGALRHRAPLVCKLGIGPLRVEAPDAKHIFFIDEGFAQVLGNHLTILTQQAKATTDLDADQAQKNLVEARALKITEEASFIARDKAVQRAQVQIKLSRTGRAKT